MVVVLLYTASGKVAFMEPGNPGLDQREDALMDYDCAGYLAEDVKNLPERPVPAVQRNFTQYFALGERPHTCPYLLQMGRIT